MFESDKSGGKKQMSEMELESMGNEESQGNTILTPGMKKENESYANPFKKREFNRRSEANAKS